MDIMPLSSSLPRQIIVLVRSSSTVGNVDVVVEGRIFGMRGVSLLSGEIFTFSIQCLNQFMVFRLGSLSHKTDP